jgi:hypothetical protein
MCLFGTFHFCTPFVHQFWQTVVEQQFPGPVF